MRRARWIQTALDAWWLGVESSTVIALRTMKLAGGGAAASAEAQKMLHEKLESGLVLQQLALTGRLGATPQGAAAKTIRHYRRKVRANRRRLLGE